MEFSPLERDSPFPGARDERPYSTRPGSGILLFDEDFDLPPPEAEPEVILPVFSAAEMSAAREEAARDSREEALAEASAAGHATSRLALTEIGAQIAAARTEVAANAEQSSEAIARLLMDCFATAFPALSARHGPAEAAAVLHAILPVLHREPNITVRINPRLVAEMTEEFATIDPDLTARIRLTPTDAMAIGDVRVTWENGAAARDTASLWTQIENILAPAGLLTASASQKTGASQTIGASQKIGASQQIGASRKIEGSSNTGDAPKHSGSLNTDSTAKEYALVE
jgi:flagellar biosynthesis/type III secretory pathway protein FliH